MLEQVWPGKSGEAGGKAVPDGSRVGQGGGLHQQIVSLRYVDPRRRLRDPQRRVCGREGAGWLLTAKTM